MTKAALLDPAYALFHVPELVRYGPKPTRVLSLNSNETLKEVTRAHLRSFDAMPDYPPTEVLLGNLAARRVGSRQRKGISHPGCHTLATRVAPCSTA